MKKVLIGAMVILSLGIVGCGKKENLNVNFENYSYEAVDGVNGVVEYIEVSVNGNEISKKTVENILDNMENKSMNTQLVVTSMQGAKMATITQNDKKTSTEIKEQHKSNKKCDLTFTNLDTFKESAEGYRKNTSILVLSKVRKTMNALDVVDETIDEGDIKDKSHLEYIANFLIDNKLVELGIDNLVNNSKPLMDNKEVKDSVESLIETNKAFGNMIKYSNIYKKEKTPETLNKVKDEAIKFQSAMDTYKIQYDALDESYKSLIDQI